MMPDLHPIQHLAQKCAHANLRLPHATRLFDAMYLADATSIENGNLTRAAIRAGIARTSLMRLIASPRANFNIDGVDQ